MIPSEQRQKLLGELHRNHPGTVKMKAVSQSYFWWPGRIRILSHLHEVVWIAKL